jgi:hypothetical protein
MLHSTLITTKKAFELFSDFLKNTYNENMTKFGLVALVLQVIILNNCPIPEIAILIKSASFAAACFAWLFAMLCMGKHQEIVFRPGDILKLRPGYPVKKSEALAYIAKGCCDTVEYGRWKENRFEKGTYNSNKPCI